jgi:hypothetical protein
LEPPSGEWLHPGIFDSAAQPIVQFAVPFPDKEMSHLRSPDNEFRTISPDAVRL